MNSPHHSDASAPAPVSRREQILERVTLIHVGAFLIMATWAYGGNAPWARTLLAGWGTLSLPLLGFILHDTVQRRSCLPRSLHCLWPLLGLNLLVLASLLNPGFRMGTYEGDILYINNRISPLIPSSARPELSAGALWLFDAIYLSCFNLVLGIKRRHSFRILLMVQLVNGLALAVFGTLQKLSHSTGLYFGLQASPQPRFFASFIYHNHWGAYTALMLVVGIGLFMYYLHRNTLRDLVRTPAMFAAMAVLFLALSIPLSGSRSGSLMALFLILIALMHAVALLLKSNRQRGKSNYPALIGIAFALSVFLGAAYKISEPVIRERLSDTRQQVAEIKQSNSLGQRLVLYQDTWRMARERLLFGWGMGSYPMVFMLYNTQDRGAEDRLPHYYHDAHSDWLQSVAELGLVGTALIGLCGLVPLWLFRHSLWRGSIANYLLLGNALLLLYAWVEFPFGNVAVVIAFWLCYFTALAYGRAESTR